MSARLIACVALVMGLAFGQNLEYHFTMGVTSPAPVPGKPFTFTWTGGEPTEAVYIVLNGYFPNTPSQNTIYGTTDILSNAPNNGSWTYNVPLNIEAGRHSFSIGYNPLQLSDQTPIFTIQSSQTSAVTGSTGSSTTNTAFQSYNGCGLPPLPDYTYTGYQAPCTVTTSGRVETIYSIVPASDSSSIGGAHSVSSTTSTSSPTMSSSTRAELFPSSTSMNTAFATGVYAQALQCPTPVTPSPLRFINQGTTTVLSLVNCTTASASTFNSAGICHTSGYTTFPVSGSSSVCCPSQWTTSSLNAQMLCYTSAATSAMFKERQIDTTFSQYSSTTISDLVFTFAGVVTHDAATETRSSTTRSSPTSATSNTSAGTGSAASASPTKSDSRKLNVERWGSWGTISVIAALCFVY